MIPLLHSSTPSDDKKSFQIFFRLMIRSGPPPSSIKTIKSVIPYYPTLVLSYIPLMLQTTLTINLLPSQELHPPQPLPDNSFPKTPHQTTAGTSAPVNIACRTYITLNTIPPIRLFFTSLPPSTYVPCNN